MIVKKTCAYEAFFMKIDLINLFIELLNYEGDIKSRL